MSRIAAILPAAGLGTRMGSDVPKQFLELAGGHNDGFIFMREAWVKALGDFLGEWAGASCTR